MYTTRTDGRLAGRIHRVPSGGFPHVWHWGIEGWYPGADGRPTIWHSQKKDVLRCTSFEEFAPGLKSHILWTPQNYEQQVWIIERLESIERLPWNLATANCEQVVRWAVEGRAHSDQLAGGVFALCCVGALTFFGLKA